MLRVELLAIEPKEAGSLVPDQIGALRSECRGDWRLVELALATGARRGELLAIVWTDLG